MPVIVAQALSMAGGLLATMAMQLLTSKFIKRVIVIGLQKVVNRTEDDWDNELLEEAKKAWGM